MALLVVCQGVVLGQCLNCFFPLFWRRLVRPGRCSETIHTSFMYTQTHRYVACGSGRLCIYIYVYMQLFAYVYIYTYLQTYTLGRHGCLLTVIPGGKDQDAMSGLIGFWLCTKWAHEIPTQPMPSCTVQMPCTS